MSEAPSPTETGMTRSVVARQHSATHIATNPPKIITLRWRAMKPDTIAPSPSSAARLNRFEPMTTPEPISRWCCEMAEIDEVISGASAASAATTPSNASESPMRSPTRSRRVTSTQLKQRLTSAPTMNAMSEGATAVSFQKDNLPTRLPGAPLKRLTQRRIAMPALSQRARWRYGTLEVSRSRGDCDAPPESCEDLRFKTRPAWGHLEPQAGLAKVRKLRSRQDCYLLARLTRSWNVRRRSGRLSRGTWGRSRRSLPASSVLQGARAC
jgi:hypothetical protein